MYTKSFLKWAGSKYRVLPALLDHLPKRSEFGNYHEPFLGSGVVLLNLAPTKAYLGDAVESVISAFTAVRDSPDKVIEKLQEYEKRHSPETYKQARQELHLLKGVEQGAALIYLNKTCFNGLYRTNRSGIFNTPIGDCKSKICDSKTIRDASGLLEGAEFTAGDFRGALRRVEAGDLVYLDPPYYSDQAEIFSSYVKRFGEKETLEVRDVANSLRDKGAIVVVSSMDCPFVREIYKGWYMEKVVAKRSMRPGSGNKDSLELIIKSCEGRIPALRSSCLT